jgi:hypothetical protein
MSALRCQFVSASTLALAALCCGVDHASRGQIQNAAEVRHEIQVAAGTEAAVKDYFPSFLDIRTWCCSIRSSDITPADASVFRRIIKLTWEDVKARNGL